ncbi:MAG: hypothetical protein ACK5TK_09070 [Betaproteobacteria bacterium]
MSGLRRVLFIAVAVAAAIGSTVLAVQGFGAFNRRVQFLSADGQRVIAVRLIVVGVLLGALGAYRAAKGVEEQGGSPF